MTTDKTIIHLLYVTSQEHRFCLSLDEVERLLLLMEVQTVPNSPDYLVGFMNLYGDAIPVIDLALRIGLKHQKPYTLQTPLALVNYNQQKFALIVDTIEGVKKLNKEQLRGEKLFEGGVPPVKATISTKKGTALLLDTQRILDINFSAMSIPLVLGDELLSLCQTGNNSVQHSKPGQHG